MSPVTRRHHCDDLERPSAAELKPTSSHRQRQQRHPAQLRQRQQRTVRLAETDYAPGESTEWHRTFEPLLGHPDQGEPQRPAGQARARRRRAARTAPETAHTSPTAPATGPKPDQSADPRQQRQIERQPEQEAVAERHPDRSVDGRVSTPASTANDSIAAHHQASGGKLAHIRQAGADRREHPRRARHQPVSGPGHSSRSCGLTRFVGRGDRSGTSPIAGHRKRPHRDAPSAGTAATVVGTQTRQCGHAGSGIGGPALHGVGRRGDLEVPGVPHRVGGRRTGAPGCR